MQRLPVLHPLPAQHGWPLDPHEITVHMRALQREGEAQVMPHTPQLVAVSSEVSQPDAVIPSQFP